MCTALTLRCVRLEPRWASAAAQLRAGGAWHELSEASRRTLPTQSVLHPIRSTYIYIFSYYYVYH